MAAAEISARSVEQHNENLSPRQQVHRGLVSEGLDWLDRLKEQPEGPSEEEVNEWSSFLEAVSLYGRVATEKTKDTSPVRRRTSTRTKNLRRFLEEELLFLTPTQSAQKDLRRHPDGVDRVREELKRRKVYDPNNKGQQLALNRASEIFKEMKNK